MFAQTPSAPYYAVIFTADRTPGDDEAYDAMAMRIYGLATQQPGFLGAESARSPCEIVVSYWADEASILAWKAQVDHQEAQRLGRDRWYSGFRIRVARVERDYGMG